MLDKLFGKKGNAPGDGADIRTYTIEVNLTAARVLITEIITFLCFFMPITLACRVVAATLLVIGCPASWWPIWTSAV